MEKQLENPLYANLPERLEAIKELGAIWARSGAIKANRVEQGQIALAYCICSGITMLEFNATYHLVDGVPKKLAMACLAQFKKMGGKFRWGTDPDDKEKATGEFDYQDQKITVTFTMEDAKQQGLVKGGSTWVKAPSYMLRARVATTGVGMLCPEAVAGAEAAPDEAPQVAPQLKLGTEPDDKAKEEKELADQGLAPAQPPAATKEKPPTKPKAAAKPKTAKTPPAQIPAPGEGKKPGPIPPPSTIEPKGFKDPKPEQPPQPPPQMEGEELAPDTVDELGRLFSGRFVKVANWMVKEKWIPAPDKELATENAAAGHLQVALRNLDPKKAKKVIDQQAAFLRAVDPPTK